uniref:Uncharacterized protein n=1 Tax=Alexandrium monilatum TaxID=311494 RepID=A0A7S4Q9U6_9DINO
MSGETGQSNNGKDLHRERWQVIEDDANDIEVIMAEVVVPEGGLGFGMYCAICFVAASTPCLLTCIFWSDMGTGRETTEILENKVLAYVCGLGLVELVIALYLLDFFWPPHLPGMYLAFAQRDPILRFAIIGLMGALVGAACVFISEDYPYMPSLVTVLTGPVLMTIIRSCAMPVWPTNFRGTKSTAAGALQIIANKKVEEADARNFYAGAMTAFLLTGGMTVLGWLLWVFGSDLDLTQIDFDNKEKEREYIRWLTPLIAGVGNLSMGGIVALRVQLAKDNQATADLRVDLICQVDEADPDDFELDSREKVVAMQLRRSGAIEVFKRLSVKDQQVVAREQMHNMVSLFKTIKVVGCCFLTLLGCAYVTFSLVAADSHVSQMIVLFMGMMFMCFTAFLCLSFWRLIETTKDWFFECPLGRMATSLSQNDWFRAIFLCLVLPAIPPVLLLSAMNQLVRKCRGLYTRIPPRRISAFKQQVEDAPEGAGGGRASRATLTEVQIEVLPAPQDQLFTERFMLQIEAARRWDYMSIVPKIFIVAVAFILMSILTPKLLNVFLSWLSKLLKDGVPFGLTVVFTVAAGIICFLLPPVPGLPVYLFTGAIIASTCPFGFGAGCGISVGMTLLLKLMACAMQQKGIGETLGNSMWIKSQVGVNKPFFRAVERILQKPGLSVGKVAILCGGPDWPTSVLCGLLRCSLAQMELGTLPIIVFTGPCTLYGAFYTKKNQGQVYSNAANLMLLLSVATNLVFGVSAAWAVQDELDAFHWEVTKPLEKYIDMDWLDYRAAQISQSCVVRWSDAPLPLRVFALCCVVVEICVCHYLNFFSTACFGKFDVTDDINTLVWYGEDGLFKFQGVLGLLLSLAGLSGYLALSCFLQKKQAGPYAARAELLDASEGAWKEERAYQASLAERSTLRSASEILMGSRRLSQVSETPTAQKEPSKRLTLRKLDKE